VKRNGHRGTSYNGKLSELEAFERCHPEVRDALRSCVFKWSSAWALNYQRKNGSKATVKMLREADTRTIAKGWMRGCKSPCLSYRVKPLYS